MASPIRQSIRELHIDMEAGLSPVELVDTCLRRIGQENQANRAMIFVDAEGALAAAERAGRELREGRPRGPLHGIPIAVKDVIDVAGWPTTAGSRLFDGPVAATDASCVANLKAAGAIIIGKTNMHELTAGSHDNPWFGKVVNPLDSNRGTGGTSSGSAGAVAAGFCVAAIGTDTGGSNRSTAAATGLFGFKPTNGLIAATGVHPSAVSLDTIGPITLTVDDARLVTAALAARPLGQAGTRGKPLEHIVLATCPDLYAANVDPAVTRSHAAWLDSLSRAGVRITEIPFGDNTAFVEAGLAILQFEFAGYYRQMVEQHPERVSEPVRAFLAAAVTVDQARYEEAQALRKQASSAFMKTMEDIDLLAIPTTPGLAPFLDGELTRVGDQLAPYGLAGGRFRRWANMFNMPALAIPLPTNEALPASIQLAAMPGRDADLFDMAEVLVGERG